MVLPEITHKLPHYKPIKNTFYLKKVFFIEPQPWMANQRL